MYRSNRIVRTCGPFLSLSYLHYKSWEKYPHTGTNPVSEILAIMYLSPIDSFDWALINRLICEDSLPKRNQPFRSEEHTSELQSLMRISYAVFCLIKQNT